MTEAQEQKEIVAWFRAEYPRYARSLRVSQGGATRGRGRNGAIRMAVAKSQGYVEGEADIAVLLPRGEWGSLVIEHKAAESGHTLSQEQFEYLEYHRDIGNCACCTRGVEAAQAAIRAYMAHGH